MENDKKGIFKGYKHKEVFTRNNILDVYEIFPKEWMMASKIAKICIDKNIYRTYTSVKKAITKLHEKGLIERREGSLYPEWRRVQE